MSWQRWLSLASPLLNVRRARPTQRLVKTFFRRHYYFSFISLTSSIEVEIHSFITWGCGVQRFHSLYWRAYRPTKCRAGVYYTRRYYHRQGLWTRHCQQRLTIGPKLSATIFLLRLGLLLAGMIRWRLMQVLAPTVECNTADVWSLMICPSGRVNV